VNLRPVAKVHGGKWYLKQFIIDKFPKNYEQMIYVEPFGGAGNVLQNKVPSRIEVYNDLNPGIVNLIWHVTHGPPEFFNLVKEITYTEDSFKQSLANLSHKDSLTQAIAELISRRMSRGGLQKNFAWSKRLRGGQPGDVNAFDTFKLQLEKIKERWKDVIIHNDQAESVILQYDSPNTLIYNDPPYLPSTRKVLNTYKEYDMIEEQHISLAKLLNRVRGKVILSGYPSSLYSELYKGWNVVQRKVKNHSGQGKKKEDRIEMLWINY
jgi:DNA adenine methylase